MKRIKSLSRPSAINQQVSSSFCVWLVFVRLSRQLHWNRLQLTLTLTHVGKILVSLGLAQGVSLRAILELAIITRVRATYDQINNG